MVGVRLGEVQRQQLICITYRKIPLNTVAAVGLFDDLSGSSFIVLIADFSNDLLEQVLERDQTLHSSVLVDHHRHVFIGATQHSQRVIQFHVCRNEYWGASDVLQIHSPASPDQPAEILVQDDANDVIQ